MKCPSCGFENMRGTERCISCRARLILAAPAGPALPPRAGKKKWLAPWRRAGNRMMEIIPSWLQTPATWLARWLKPPEGLSGEAVAAIYISLVPGFGHIMKRRWRAGLIRSGIWLGLLAVALCFWGSGSFYSLMLAGLPLSWHVSMMADAGRINRLVEAAGDRLRLMMVHVFLPCLTMYAAAFWLGSQFFQISRTSQAVPPLGIQPGDAVLLRNLSGRTVLHRGDLVVAGWDRWQENVWPIASRGRVIWVLQRPMKRPRLAVVLAFPGEQVEISGAQAKVNGILLPTGLVAPSEARAGPESWLPVTIAKNQILVSGRISPVSRDQIDAQAVAVWFPLSRRHLLPALKMAGIE